MNVKYDKAALQEYMNQVGVVGEQMRRKQDESFNIYNSCKQQYTRIHTKLEEVMHRAYNQVENAESMRRNAEIEYETARRSVEHAEDEDEKNVAMQRMRQARIMQEEADKVYSKVSADYSKASSDLRNLSELWEGRYPLLESQANRLEDRMLSFSRLVANANSDLGEYISLMDKAQDTLHENSKEGASSNGGSVSSDGVVNTAGAQSVRCNSGQQTTDAVFRSEVGNTVSIVAATNGLKAISMSIGGKTQTFPGTKSGIARAHRNALKNNDIELASYTSKMFSDADFSNDSDAGKTSEAVSSDTISIGSYSSSVSRENAQIAATMVVNGLVRQADFGKLDNRTAQDIHKSVSETLKMFPDIDLCFVGSIQSRNQHIERNLEKMYLDTYRSFYPEASEEELMPFVRQHVAEDMKGLEPGDGTIAQSLFVAMPQEGNDDIIARFNGISINEQYGGDYNYFTDVRQSDVQAKWKPAGCDTPRATVDHELGHQIAKLTNAHNDIVIQKMYSDFMKLNNTQRGEALSGYAGESIHEFIAEGWSEYRNNPNCRTLAMNIANRLFDLYNQRTLSLMRIRR